MPSIFISVDDLISIFWFITREQFYAISQVNGQFDLLSDKLLERYPQKDVDSLRIKATESSDNGQENQLGNRLLIERKQSKEEKEIPFAINLHNYPKIGQIRFIQITAPLQEYALTFLQGCKQNFHKYRREVYFSDSFDTFVQFHTADQLITFSKVFQGLYAVQLGFLPDELDAFAQFLNITECRKIEINLICESDVEPFVEWLAQNPLKRVFSSIRGSDEQIPKHPNFIFKFFCKNVPKLLATKCRQVFNFSCKSANASTIMSGMCPYYNLDFHFGYEHSNFFLPIIERFRMRNRGNGDVFVYKNRGNKFASIVCKPNERIPQLAMRSTGAGGTKIWVDFDIDEDNDENDEE